MKCTLFNSEFLQRFADFRDKKLPYSIALKAFAEMDSHTVPEDEVSIFTAVVEHEVCAYEPRGYLCGPVTLSDPKRKSRKPRPARKPLHIPSFVEEDTLSIVHCDAKGLLLINDETVFNVLAKSASFFELGVILITSCGIPRLGTRRLIRRFERDFNLPVMLLTDNDTWGYWTYSILKRGLMAPAMKSQYSAITNLSLIGVRAGDWEEFAVPVARLRPWEEQWGIRLREIRRQFCFRSKQWRLELDRFAADRFGLDLRVLLEHLGVRKFINLFLKPRMEQVLESKGGHS